MTTETKPGSLLRRGLSLILFLLPFPAIWITEERFLNGAKWEYGTLGIYATEGLLWLCAILFILWYWQRTKLLITDYGLQITKDRLFISACLLFTLYSLLSVFWVLDQPLAFQHALHIIEACILFFMLWLGPLTWRAAASWFVAGATLQGIIGIGQFLSQSTIAIKWLGMASHPAWEAGSSIIVNESGRWLRAYGALPHPNILGGYLVAGLILTTLLWHRTHETNRTDKLTSCLLPSAFCLQTAALFFTFSRSAWLAWAVWIIGLFIYFANKNYRLLITDYRLFLSSVAAGIIVFALLSIIFFPLVQTRISGASPNELTSQSERLSGYSEAWQLFKSSPWLGVGPGHYTLAAYALNPDRPGWEYQPVHNVLWLMLVELGVVGMALVGAVIAAGIGLMRRIRPANKPLLFTLYSFSFSFPPIILFDHYLYSTYIGLLLVAVGSALIWRQSPNHLST